MSAHAEAERGLYTTLTNAPTLGAYVGRRIYNQFPPQGVEFPHVVFLFNSGADSNEQAVRMLDLRYTIKCVSTSMMETQIVAGMIEDVLHEQAFAVTAPYKVMRCQRISVFKFHEMDDRVIYHHMGGIYRIRVCEE